MKSIIKGIILLIILLHVQNLAAAEMTFNFKDPKGVNGISIFLDSLLEPIVGVAGNVSGEVVIDLEKNRAISGKIEIPVNGIQMANKTMTKALLSEDWLDAEKYPFIQFMFKKIISSKRLSHETQEFTIAGDFSCHGVVKEIQVPVHVSILPGQLKARNHSGEGDLMVLRTQFKISRLDFKINPAAPTLTVSNDIQLNVGIVGFAEK